MQTQLDPYFVGQLVITLLAVASAVVAVVTATTRTRRIEPQPLAIAPDAQAQRLDRIEGSISRLSEQLASQAGRVSAVEAAMQSVTEQISRTHQELAELRRRVDAVPAQVVAILRNTHARFDDDA